MVLNKKQKAEQEDHHKWRWQPTRHPLKVVAVL